MKVWWRSSDKTGMTDWPFSREKYPKSKSSHPSIPSSIQVMVCLVWNVTCDVLQMIPSKSLAHGVAESCKSWVGSAPFTNSHQDHVQHFWPRESRTKLTLFATVGRVCRSKSWDLTRHDWWQQPSFTPLHGPRVSALLWELHAGIERLFFVVLT